MPYRPRFTSEGQDRVLQKSLDVLQSGSVAVIDLDGVLFDTRARQVRIIQMFAKQRQDALLAQIQKVHFYDWSLSKTLMNLGLDQEKANRRSKELRPFWERHFFAPEAVLWDDALPGAAEWVAQVQSAGATVVYLTGRTEAIRVQTIDALQSNSFPWEGCHLFMKPNAAIVDHEFKEEALERISALGPVALGIDNEPIQINHLAHRFPDAFPIWMCTDHSPRPVTVRKDMARIHGFLRTKKALSEG